MFKKDNGVTLTALVITIIIMLLILSISIVSATDLIRNTRKK